MNTQQTTSAAVQITNVCDEERTYAPLNVSVIHAGSPDPSMRASSRKRRNSIIDSARELFETKGYAHTNIQDITQNIGLTRSLFYHYFPDKEAVTQAVIDSYIDEYITRFKDAIQNTEHHHIENILANAINAAYYPEFRSNNFVIELHEKENAALYGDLLNRSAQRSADLILETLEANGLPDELREVHTFERYYIFFLGLFNYFHLYQDVSSEAIHTLIKRSLPIQRSEFI